MRQALGPTARRPLVLLPANGHLERTWGLTQCRTRKSSMGRAKIAITVDEV
jgi:hypothetical protein